jgi:hypothetical protein
MTRNDDHCHSNHIKQKNPPRKFSISIVLYEFQEFDSFCHNLSPNFSQVVFQNLLPLFSSCYHLVHFDSKFLNFWVIIWIIVLIINLLLLIRMLVMMTVTMTVTGMEMLPVIWTSSTMRWVPSFTFFECQ